jgi:predicted transcriptional regulator
MFDSVNIYAAMSSPQLELTPSEWTIMRAVWRHEPCAAPTVQEALQAERGWAYSTVRTLMDRMAAKGLLTTEKVRHLTLFRSAVTESQAQQGELLYTLKTAFQGALSPMVQCLLEHQELSSRELAELEALIKTKRRQTEKR